MLFMGKLTRFRLGHDHYVRNDQRIDPHLIRVVNPPATLWRHQTWQMVENPPTIHRGLGKSSKSMVDVPLHAMFDKCS